MQLTLRLFTVAATAALSCGCLSSRPVPGTSQAQSGQSLALGSFEVGSPALGSPALAPTECTPGDAQFFLGADFADVRAGAVVRLVVDPLGGAAARVFSAAEPFDKSVVFTRAECAVFHFSLDTTGWRFNRVNDYRVTLQLDCSRPGEWIRGSASSTHCH